ncbi:MAG: LD-carboxypeptidase [Bacteroidia bacterium]|nr:LD-carboxypeptidase [Bacteroidia bacterium]
MYLSKGDLIGITAPAGKIKEESLSLAVSVLESWGLVVNSAKNIFSDTHGYFAGTDEERRQDFQEMLDDPNLKAIICARGGYGTTRFIDQLDFTGYLKFPKWIVGFSDVTALHLKLHQLGFESIHSVMPIQFTKPDHKESIESLRRMLFGERTQLKAKGSSFNRIGSTTAQVVGGNLTLLVDSLGTSTEVQTHGKILVIEEVDEYRYKIDRMLNQLKRANKLHQLAGLIVGHMTDIHDTENSFGQTVEELTLEKAADFAYPVGFNFPIGHEAPNYAWRHGAIASFTVGKDKSSLVFE